MYNTFVFSWKASGVVLRLWAGSRASLHKDRWNFIWNQRPTASSSTVLSSRVFVMLTMLSCKQDKQASLVCLSAAGYRCEFVIWSCQKSPPPRRNLIYRCKQLKTICGRKWMWGLLKRLRNSRRHFRRKASHYNITALCAAVTAMHEWFHTLTYPNLWNLTAQRFKSHSVSSR